MLNRKTAPQIRSIKQLNTGFPHSETNLFTIASDEGVFKLEIIYPYAGFSIVKEKYNAIFGMELLLSGTQSFDSNNISEQLDILGAYVFKNCDYYTSSATIYGLNENLKSILKIVKDSMDNCIYPLDEVNLLKTRKSSELKINLNKTNYLANRQINSKLFGSSHPYATHLTEEIIDKITSENLQEFRLQSLNKPYFIFTGNPNENIKVVLQEQGFKVDTMEEIVTTEVEPCIEKLDSIVVKPGSTQNSIRLGKKLPSRQDPDFFKISLLNLILGGYFGSRLMKNIREEKGLTYGIHSSIIPFKTFSVLKISSECNNKLSAQVKQEIEFEIKKLQTELIDNEELITAKNYFLGAISRNFDGPFNISERFKSFLEFDKNYQYYNEFFKAIELINPEDLRACANNYLDINSLEYCIAGEM